MSLIENNVALLGLKGKKTVRALFDSGASYSCIRRDIAEEITQLDRLEEIIEFSTADEGASIIADYVVHLSFYFSDSPRRFTDEFIVLDTLSEDVLIGASTMQKWKIKLDFDREEVQYDRKMHRLRI